MTEGDAGMTEGDAGMTELDAGMTVLPDLSRERNQRQTGIWVL